MKKTTLLYAAVTLCTLSSCGGPKLVTTGVGYQSIRTHHAQPTPSNPIPNNAEIAVAYALSKDGNLTAVVYNRTSEIMIIDQTMSFFVNSDGQSTSYYDPTIRTTSVTNSSSTTKGGSVNLGAVAGALGIGGTMGQLASGINLGGAGTTGSSTTSSTYIADQPRVALAPHSNGAMSKVYKVKAIDPLTVDNGPVMQPQLSAQMSPYRFSVCISYSLDNGATFKKLVTEFYASAMIALPVAKGKNGYQVNETLRQIYAAKPDALSEPWWMLNFVSNVSSGMNERIQGLLYDYQ